MEFYILAALVAIVAIIAAVMIGGIPGAAPSTMDSNSQKYWLSANPFQITEWAQTNGTFYLTLINKGGARLILRRLEVGGVPYSFGAGKLLQPDSLQSVSFGGFTRCDKDTYDRYSYGVEIYYDSTEKEGFSQVGEIPLEGKCAYS